MGKGKRRKQSNVSSGEDNDLDSDDDREHLGSILSRAEVQTLALAIAGEDATPSSTVNYAKFCTFVTRADWMRFDFDHFFTHGEPFGPYIVRGDSPALLVIVDAERRALRRAQLAAPFIFLANPAARNKRRQRNEHNGSDRHKAESDQLTIGVADSCRDWHALVSSSGCTCADPTSGTGCFSGCTIARTRASCVHMQRKCDNP